MTAKVVIILIWNAVASKENVGKTASGILALTTLHARMTKAVVVMNARKEGTALEKNCKTESDCKQDPYEHQWCCYGSCAAKDCHQITAVLIVGSICGQLFLLFLIYVCICFVRRHRRSARYGRILTSQRSSTTPPTGFTGERNPPPYLGQDPPSYRQTYPYYPPPQYEQHQTAKASEAPPPYTATPEGGPGRDICS